MVKHYGIYWCGSYTEEFWKSERNLCKDYSLMAEHKQNF